MGNSIGTDILIHAPDPSAAALFYVEQLGFEVTAMHPGMISLHGQHVNLFIEAGPTTGPILEITVRDVEATSRRLQAQGCVVIQNEPAMKRIYLRDPFGMMYNLRSAGA